MRHFKFSSYSVLIGLVAASTTCRAADCKITNYGTLPVEIVGNRATALLRVNGQETRFMLDTGASFNAMSQSTAGGLGLARQPAPPGLVAKGMGGVFNVTVATVKELGILGGSIPNVEFFVGGSDTGMPLLGSNILNAVDLDLDLAQGKLRLMKPVGCEKLSMAYWVTGGSYRAAKLYKSDKPRDQRSFVDVMINGKAVRALLDTGAPVTLISRRAAEGAGLNLAAPEVTEGPPAGGFGRARYRTLIVPVQSFAVGTETIQNSKMQVVEGDMGDLKMLLGLDFIMAHHIFIANSQKVMYFTYNGGRVFGLAKPPSAGALSPRQPADEKITADDFALRGQARLGRGELEAALADLDSAIRLAPNRASFHLARARAHIALVHPDAAMVDADKAIALDPVNFDALLLRAGLHFRQKNQPAALDDVAAAQKLIQPGSSQSRAIASFYVANNQPTLALPILDRWVSLHGQDVGLGSALNARCWARGLANQQPELALDDCNKAIKRDGAVADYLDSLGLVFLRLKRHDDAIKAYSAAVDKAPASAVSRYGLGLAKVRRGQFDAGNADIAAAKAMEPKVEELFVTYGI